MDGKTQSLSGDIAIVPKKFSAARKMKSCGCVQEIPTHLWVYFLGVLDFTSVTIHENLRDFFLVDIVVP